jgi:hypothetical protein
MKVGYFTAGPATTTAAREHPTEATPALATSVTIAAVVERVQAALSKGSP